MLINITNDNLLIAFPPQNTRFKAKLIFWQMITWLNEQFQMCKKLSKLFYRWGGIRIEWTPGGKCRSCCRINQIYHPGAAPLFYCLKTHCLAKCKMQTFSLNLSRTNSILSGPSQNWISGHASASEKGRQLQQWISNISLYSFKRGIKNLNMNLQIDSVLI